MRKRKDRLPTGRRKSRPVIMSQALAVLREKRQQLLDSGNIVTLASYVANQFPEIAYLRFDPRFGALPVIQARVEEKSELAPILLALRQHGLRRSEPKARISKATRTMSYRYPKLLVEARVESLPQGESCSYEEIGKEVTSVEGLVCRYPDGTIKTIDGVPVADWEERTGRRLK